jgi:uncharacterized membrane protein HdeD (DUF308 family)
MLHFYPDDTEEAVRELGRSWWLFLLIGILWLVFAWIVLSFNFDTVWAIAIFAGCAFIAGGIGELFMASQVRSWRWLYILLGIVSIIAGIFCFAWPGQTFLVLAAILAWYLLFKGVFDIIEAFMTKDIVDLWWLTLIIGIAEVLIGFWAVGYAGRSIALLVIWVAAMALSRGIVNIFLAFKVRKFKDITPTATAPVLP